MLVPKQVNADLAKERKNASFSADEFATWFYDGADKLQMKRFIENELLADFKYEKEDDYLSYEDLCGKAVKDSAIATTKLKSVQNKINPNGTEVYPAFPGTPNHTAIMPTGSPFSGHMVMFANTIESQGTAELYEQFGKRAQDCAIIGAYAQTELGHGTFVRGLETRADYDRKTDEFVLNTPTLTSYKWWPGGLGHAANYCILVAQLYIDNKSKGTQLFLLQVRDEETHMPLEGIHIGEIGFRLGILGVNNGFLGLKNVRIPRTQMLMKNAQVLPDGTFVKSPKSQLIYMPMVLVRCIIAYNYSLMLSQAATIATRYSAVRRQSSINPNEPEPQIMDHVTHQMKIFPEIAISIADRLASKCLWKLHDDTALDITKGNFSRLPELHALACALKVSCSYNSVYGIERLRQSCGGHGYLVASNFGNLFFSASSACTIEGENSVLYLQVGKILFKSWTDIRAGKPLMPTMAYLSECCALKEFPKWTGDWNCMVRALQYITTCKTRIAFKSFNERLKKGQTNPVALNNTGIELTQAAELHGYSFTASNFLLEVTKSHNRSPAFQNVLEQLLELYLLHTTLQHLADFLRFIRITATDLADIQSRLESVLAKIRPNAVAICDGFDFPDAILCSVLGAYDGNVYERIFESAQKNPLNKEIVPKSFEQYLKPFMKSNM